MEEYDSKVRAPVEFLDVDPEDIEEDYGETYSLGRQQYLVLTDDEADDMWDEEIERYIDDCILPELPEQYQSYFNRESFREAAQMDGRGHILASYDGDEHETEDPETGEDLFIYRVN